MKIKNKKLTFVHSHITSNIIFLALWGENNFDYNTINLLPFILRALSLCLIILVIWAVSPELETGGSESMLLKPSAVLGCLVMVETVLRIALKIATSVFSDVFEGPADVLEIIYATTITLLVVMVCWVCVRSIARMRSSSSSSSSSGGADTTPATPAAAAAGRSLVAWVSLLTISSVTYTLTHLVFASYFRIVEPPISPPTALALNAIRLLGPAIALVSVLGISLCRPIRDDPCTATTATATTTATITASTATADDDTITPSESKEKKEVV